MRIALGSHPRGAVIDASVGVQLVLNEDLSEQARRVLARDAGNQLRPAYVPELFFVECANVLRKAVGRRGLSRADATAGVRDLEEIDLVPVSTRGLEARALTLALERSLTVYDACYLVLAAHLGVPLVTADETLVHLFASGGGPTVVSLRSVS